MQLIHSPHLHNLLTGDSTVLPAMVEAVRSGQWKWIGGGRHLTSTINVLNCCGMFSKLIASSSQTPLSVPSPDRDKQMLTCILFLLCVSISSVLTCLCNTLNYNDCALPVEVLSIL